MFFGPTTILKTYILYKTTYYNKKLLILTCLGLRHKKIILKTFFNKFSYNLAKLTFQQKHRRKTAEQKP